MNLFDLSKLKLYLKLTRIFSKNKSSYLKVMVVRFYKFDSIDFTSLKYNSFGEIPYIFLQIFFEM